MVMDTGALTLSWAQTRVPRGVSRKVFAVAATTVVAMTLLSCSAPRPSADHSPTTSPIVYGPSVPVVRTPLSLPLGYASHSSRPLGHPNEGVEPQTAGHGGWRASPRWVAINGDGCIVVEQDPQAKFAAQAEAAKVRVEKCSKEDIEDLTPAHGRDGG